MEGVQSESTASERHKRGKAEGPRWGRLEVGRTDQGRKQELLGWRSDDSPPRVGPKLRPEDRDQEHGLTRSGGGSAESQLALGR